MAEQDKNELIWAKHASNNVPKQMKRVKLDRLQSVPDSGWVECSAPAVSPHAGIVVVHHEDEQEQSAGEPAKTTPAIQAAKQEKETA